MMFTVGLSCDSWPGNGQYPPHLFEGGPVVAVLLASAIETGEITGDICVKLSGRRDGGKISLASKMRETGVLYAWIGKKLGLGSADRVRVHCNGKCRNV